MNQKYERYKLTYWVLGLLLEEHADQVGQDRRYLFLQIGVDRKNALLGLHAGLHLLILYIYNKSNFTAN